MRFLPEARDFASRGGENVCRRVRRGGLRGWGFNVVVRMMVLVARKVMSHSKNLT